MMDEISYENKIKFNEPYELKQEDNSANNNIPYNIPKEIKINPTPLYIMTVDLDEEKSEKLEIYMDSVPQKLAFDFSKKHNLDFDAMQFLVDEISKLLVHNENQKTTNNIPECIQEVDEDMNSELYRTHDLEKSKMKKEDISIKKEDTSPNRLPVSDKSLTTFTNNEDNKSKNISNNNISHHHNQSNISMSKTNNVSKSSKVEQHKPLDIKQFSYQLFLDKSSKSDLKGTNKTYNDNRKSNIFEKLYQEAKERKINNKQAATIDSFPTKVKNSDISNYYKSTSFPNEKEHINFGERLYMKGIKLKENSSKKIENMKLEKQNMEKEICTFKPSLLENNFENNIELLKGRIANNRTDILLNYQQYKNEQIEKLKEKHQKEEVYPFSPKINKNTNTFLNSKMNKPYSTGSDNNIINTSKPTDLHERYKQRLIKIKMLEESIYKNSFTPTINNNIQLQSTFSERQDAFKKRVREHSEDIKKNFMFDEKTGQKFFSPNRENNKTNIIIQSSEVDQRRKSLCDYMFSYSKKFTQKKENITKLMNDNYDKRVKMRHTNNTTEMIYNRRKVEVFRRIFNTLDRDGEGTISSYNNNLKHLPPALQYILEPIITKIKVDNCRFNEEQFIDSCENLFENLPYDQKLIIMNYYKPLIKRNKSAGDNFTFKPSLNRRQQRNIIRLDKKSLNNSTSSSSMNHLRRHSKYINSNYILSSEK